MQFDKTVDDRDRLARIVLAAALALVAVSSFRKERRLRGVLAGVGAIGLGYTAAVKSGDSSEPGTGQPELGIERADEVGGMSCPACGESIVVGQSRRPNADNQIVHESCL